MANFTSIEDLATEIETKLNTPSTQNAAPQTTALPKKKIIALYAFNATGKTRLSNLLSGMSEDGEVLEDETGEAIADENGDGIEVNTGRIKTLCYNAFLEDMFVWDNDDCILTFDPHHWTINLIVEQGLEKDIINNFKDIINTNGIKLEPSFNFDSGEVTFKIVSGDDASESNIKISKGEESMLIWSVFYTILQTAIDSLNTAEEERTTDKFNELKYIIIDDPVSSIDDTKIIAMAIKLIEVINEYKGASVNFLITTHHALFYNVLVNSFNRSKRKGKCEFESYSLSKDNNQLKLKGQDDSPFSYHLLVKKIIQDAIAADNIEKYHFNLFRNLLEKTAIFLGYNAWSDCIKEDQDKDNILQRLQVYSHSKGSDLEGTELSGEDKTLLEATFTTFLHDFNWK